MFNSKCGCLLLVALDLMSNNEDLEYKPIKIDVIDNKQDMQSYIFTVLSDNFMFYSHFKVSMS